MIKLFGVVLIISASSLGGFIWAEKLSDRCELIKAWMRILVILQTEIHYQSHLLPEIFQRISETSSDFQLGDAFRKAAAKLSFGSGNGVGEVWEQLIYDRSHCLTVADLSPLLDLGDYLGSTDRNDQVAKIKACFADLTLQLKEAEEKRNAKTNLYRYLGFALGAVIVLWLI